MASVSDYPILLFADRAAFRAWLSEHHASQRGLWLRIAKAASPLQSVTYAEALDVALCFGWIDGQKKTYDADTFLQKFTPRQKRSPWSKRNREHVERLVAAGEMHPAGLAAVEAAKADGRWDRAYDSATTVTVPDDFQAALAEHTEAQAFFETLKGANRYAILYRIHTAVKPETRARRIADFVAMLQRRETLHP
ncbi:YdeI/OmpD-associated family protein [Longimicrobium sp.]|uniref:YdeI/OmpD-associated family protein n=1 Tax=Longimicrobium sp. TaxID=2029185 RepID=UPI002EDB8BEB